MLSRLKRSPLQALALASLVAAGVFAAWLYSYSGWYGFNVILRRGVTTWTTVSRDDTRLPPAMRLALKLPPPPATAGSVDWRQLQAGFEVGELAVLADGTEVDRILLARISPAHFRFEVLNRPAGDRDVDDWLLRTGATLVVNGSYYAPDGLPATPIRSNARQLGPQIYDARHGAFVAHDTTVGLHDLVDRSWSSVLAGAKNALVSYPMLIGADGQSRALKSDRRWLANRSFLGEDQQGRIVVGTTKEAFFSLDRLAEFLRSSPLDLRLALNLDGGPPACQAIATKDFTRSFCGRWETQTSDDRIRLLGHLIGQRRWGLPIVLVAYPK
jgi:hypothetical protein